MVSFLGRSGEGEQASYVRFSSSVTVRCPLCTTRGGRVPGEEEAARGLTSCGRWLPKARCRAEGSPSRSRVRSWPLGFGGSVQRDAKMNKAAFPLARSKSPSGES